MDFVRFLMDQGAHFQMHPKPLTVMNVHNRARKHFSDGRGGGRGGGREGERREMMEFRLNDREAKTAFPLSALIVG